jgi:TldD protein
VDPSVVLSRAQAAGASYADVRIESVDEQRLQIQDGELRDLLGGTEQGFAVRVLVNGNWGFASSNDLAPDSWRRAIDAAIHLAKGTAGHRKPLAFNEADPVKARVHWKPTIHPRNVDVTDKQALLSDMDAAVRVFPEITNVSTSYSDSIINKGFWNSEGTDIEWSMPRTVAQVHFTAKRDGQLAGRSARVGGTRGWELFDYEDPIAKATEAAKAAVAQLDAPSAKGGRTTVIIDHELAGVFAHEAVGHASEADLVAAGESCFKGRMGERLGIAGLNIHDDSTIPGAFGSFPFDDNGIPGQDKNILEDGVLTGFLCDRERGDELGMPANGAARAQSFSHRPLVRMSNTLIEAGDHTDEEVFDVKDGIYCRGSRGGQVDTARGTFLFHAQDAFQVVNGEITQALKDVSLTGDILSTLHGIDALGNQQKMGDPGYCGKGQWVPVCDGGPLVRIQDCLVGGGS